MSNDDFFSSHPAALSPPVTPTDPIAPEQPVGNAMFSWPMHFDLPTDLPALDMALPTTDAGSPVPALEFPPPPSPESSPVAGPTAAVANEPIPALSLDDIPAMDLMDLDRAGAGLANVMPMAFDFTFSFGLPSPPPSFHEGLHAPESPLSLAAAMPSSILFGSDEDMIATPEPEPMRPQQQVELLGGHFQLEVAQGPAMANTNNGLHRHARRSAQDMEAVVQDRYGGQQASHSEDRRKRHRVSRSQPARSASPSSPARVRQLTPQSIRTTLAHSSRASVARATSPLLVPSMSSLSSASASALAAPGPQLQQVPPVPTPVTPASLPAATVVVNGFGLASPSPSSVGDDQVDMPSLNEGNQSPEDAMHVDPAPVPMPAPVQVPMTQAAGFGAAAAVPATVMLGLPAPPVAGGRNLPPYLQQQTVGGVGLAFATTNTAVGVPATHNHAQAEPNHQEQDEGMDDAMDVVHEHHHQQQVPLPDQNAAPPIFTHQTQQYQQHQVLAHATTEQHIQVHESVDTDARVSSSVPVPRMALGQSPVRSDNMHTESHAVCERAEQGDAQQEQHQAQGDGQSPQASLAHVDASSATRPAHSVVPDTTTEQHQSTEANHTLLASVSTDQHAPPPTAMLSPASSLATPQPSPTPTVWRRPGSSPPTSPLRANQQHQRPRPPSVLAALAASSAIGLSPTSRVHRAARGLATPATQVHARIQRIVPTGIASSGSGSRSDSVRVLVADYERERVECARDQQQRQREVELSGGRSTDRVDVGHGRIALQQQGANEQQQGAHSPQTNAHAAPRQSQQVFHQHSSMADAVGRRASDPRDRGGLSSPSTHARLPSVRLTSHAPGFGSAFAAAPIAVPVPVPGSIVLSTSSPLAAVGARPLSTARTTHTTHAYLPSPQSSPEPDELQLTASVQLVSTSVLVDASAPHLVAAIPLRRRPLFPVPGDAGNDDEAHQDELLAAVHVATPPPSPLAVGVDVVDEHIGTASHAQHGLARPSSPLAGSPLRPQGLSAHAADVLVDGARNSVADIGNLSSRRITRTALPASVTTTSTSPIDCFRTQARVVLSSLVALVSLTLLSGLRKSQSKPIDSANVSKPCPLPSAHVLAACSFAPALSLPALALASTTLAALQVMLSPIVTAIVRSLHQVLIRVLVSALLLAAIVTLVVVAVKWAAKLASECYAACVVEQGQSRRQQQQRAASSWYDWLVELADVCDQPQHESSTEGGDCCSWAKGASYLASWFSGSSCQSGSANSASLPVWRRACGSGNNRRGGAPSCAATHRSSWPDWFTTRRESGRSRA